MKCPNCSHVSGEQLPRFCSNCGIRLEQQADSPGVHVVSGYGKGLCGALSEEALGIHLAEDISLLSMSETDSLPPDFVPEIQSLGLSNQSVSLEVIGENQHENGKKKKKRRKKKKKNHPASEKQSANIFISDSTADYRTGSQLEQKKCWSKSDDCALKSTSAGAEKNVILQQNCVSAGLEAAADCTLKSGSLEPKWNGNHCVPEEPSELSTSLVDYCVISGNLNQREKENQNKLVHQTSSEQHCANSKAAEDSVSSSSAEQKQGTQKREHVLQLVSEEGKILNSEKDSVEKNENSSSDTINTSLLVKSAASGTAQCHELAFFNNGSNFAALQSDMESSQNISASQTFEHLVSVTIKETVYLESPSTSEATHQNENTLQAPKQFSHTQLEDESPPSLENSAKIRQDIKEKEEDHTAAIGISDSEMSVSHSKSKEDQNVFGADCSLDSAKQGEQTEFQKEKTRTGKVKTQQKLCVPDSKDKGSEITSEAVHQKQDGKLKTEEQSKESAAQAKTSDDRNMESSNPVTDEKKSDSKDELSVRVTVKEDGPVGKMEKAVAENVAALSNPASKNKKEQKNKSAATKRGEFSSVPKMEGVTVYFHAVLSKDFKISVEKDKIVIRSGKLAGDWNTDVCEMNISRDIGEHGFLLEGQTVIPKECLSGFVSYKYFIKSDKKSYEFIYKWDTPDGTPVNRCLHIDSQKLSREGEWHQYDDIICAAPSGSIKSWFKSFLGVENKNKREDIVNGKKIAGEIMLDSIFNILTLWNKVNLRSFYDQLHQFFVVYTVPMVVEKVPKKWDALRFGTKEVKELLQNCIKKMVAPFIDSETSSTIEKKAVVKSRLKAGLLSLVLTIEFDLLKSKEDVVKACKLLCIVQGPKEELSKELLELKEVFSVIPRVSDCLIQLCQRGIEDVSELWILVLPVLHLFSLPFKPFEPLSVRGQWKSSDVWAGLEGIPFDDFRKKLQPYYSDKSG